MATDAISGVIENNKKQIAHLEDKKAEYDKGIKEALEQKHSIWLKIRSFMNNCGTSNPKHLNAEQRSEYEELMTSYYGSKRSYRRNYCDFQMTCGSLFNLYLDNGELEMQKMVFGK